MIQHQLLAAPLVRSFYPPDQEALLAMTRRCSPESLRSRFLGTSPGAAEEYVTDLVTRTDHLTVVASPPELEEIVGVGSVLVDGLGGGELVLLVEDAWQGRGIGAALTRQLAVEAARHGVLALHVDMFVSNVRMRTLLDRQCPGVVFNPPDAGVVDGVILLSPALVVPRAPHD